MKTSISKIRCLISFILMAIISLGIADAQCNSNSPTILKTFGTSTTLYNSALPSTFGFSTNYIQYNGTLQNGMFATWDGQFSFVNETTDPWGNWWGGQKDHTGDVNGNMMLVNADFGPGVFYKDTVQGLCSGITYNLSAWVANLTKNASGINPNIKFEVTDFNDTSIVLGSYTTGDIVANTVKFTWQKYSLSFTSPANKVILKLINSNPGGGGNDLVLDDIAFTPCLPEYTISKPSLFCKDASVNIPAFTSSINPYINPVYQWHKKQAGNWVVIPGATTDILSLTNLNFSDTAWYKITVSAVGNLSSPLCRSEDSLYVNVTSTPPTTVTDIEYCQNASTVPLTSTGTDLKWYTVASLGTSNTSITPSSSVDGLFSYYVTQTLNGCESPRTELKVTIIPTPTPDAPINVSACDSYTLPSLTVGNFYYTATNKGGTNLADGSALTTTQTVYVYKETGTTPNCYAENTFVVTINKTPTPDAPTNVSACDSYTLPVLTAGNFYYTATNKGGTNLAEGSALTTSQTVYVYNETGTIPNCYAEKTFVVTIISTPTPDAPTSLSACDSYTLPALTAGNFYNTATNKGGTNLIAGAAITTTKTIYVYKETGTTPNCYAENTFVVTINKTPIPDAPTSVSACDSYTLPVLTAGNFYYTATNKGGTNLAEGSALTTSQTVYVYTETGTTPNCKAENSFDVTIISTPTPDALTNVSECDSYILPALTAGNFYYTATNKGGTNLIAGAAITTTQTIYVYKETGTTPNCYAENTFVVTINKTPIADAPTNVSACDSYTLPVLTAGNFYYTATNKGGTNLAEGSALTTSQTVYVYNETGTIPNCYAEKTFVVTIISTPTPDAPTNVSACDSYTLPALTAGNFYYTATNKGGTNLIAGAAITTTKTIYVYKETGTTLNCYAENTFVVTINYTPTADAPTDVVVCDSYSLPLLTSNKFYYTGTFKTGTQLAAGTIITNSQKIYVYKETGTTPNCSNENSFLITINKTPKMDNVANQIICNNSSTNQVLFISDVLNSTFNWVNSNSTIGLSSTGSNNIASFLGKSVGQSLNKAIITVTPTANNCTGSPITFSYNVVSLPTVTSVNDITVCNGDVVKSIVFNGSSATTHFAWSHTNYTIGLYSNDSGSVPSFESRNLTNVAEYSTVTVVPVDNSCVGIPISFKITVNKTPNLSILGAPQGAYCIGTALSLKGSGANIYQWVLPTNDTIVSDAYTTLFKQVSDTGMYYLLGKDLNGCKAIDSISYQFKNRPVEIGNDTTFCEKSRIEILPSHVSNTYWILPNGTIYSASQLNIMSSKYSDSGIYTIVSSDNGCVQNFEFQINVVNCSPTAIPDFYSIYSDQQVKAVHLNHPIDNDYDPNDQLLMQDFKFLNTVTSGKLDYNLDGTWTYTPVDKYEGTQILEYEICDRGQPVLCSKSTVTIEVKYRGAFFPNAFTPNNDNVNDTYVIYQLPVDVSAQIYVYNRWGDLVHKDSDYQNDWSGICTSSDCLGKELPTGTYYIVVNLSNGLKHSNYFTLSR